MNKICSKQKLEKCVDKFIESDSFNDYVSDGMGYHIGAFMRKEGYRYSFDEFIDLLVKELKQRRKK